MGVGIYEKDGTLVKLPDAKELCELTIEQLLRIEENFGPEMTIGELYAFTCGLAIGHVAYFTGNEDVDFYHDLAKIIQECSELNMSTYDTRDRMVDFLKSLLDLITSTSLS